MFDIKKFFSGFNILDGEKLGKLIFYGVLIVAGLAIYHQITRPTTNIVGKTGSKITVNQNKSKNWGIGATIMNNQSIGVSVMYFF
jgi:hypothetical protein